MSNNGFTLIEALVAIVIGVAVVLGIGALSERLVHHRTTTDSNSAAQSLAEWQMERLFADDNPHPTQVDCNSLPTGTNSCTTTAVVTGGEALCGSTTGLQHGPLPVNEAGVSSASGPYCVQWTVVDASTNAASSPLVIPAGIATPTGGVAPTKRITITVKHLKNPLVYAKVVTQYPPP